MRHPPLFLRIVAALFSLIIHVGVSHAADLASELKGLDTTNFLQKEKAIAAIVATGDPRVATVLGALGDSNLLIRKQDRRIVIGEGKGQLKLSDAASGEALGEGAEAEFDKVTINNKIRRQIKAIIGSLTLFSAEAAVRLKAAEEIFRSRDQAATEPLREALAKEADPAVKLAMEQAMAALILTSTAPDEERLAAIEVVKAKGGQDAASLLASIAAGEDRIAKAAQEALDSLESNRAWWDARAECRLWLEPWIGTAACRNRACHHLRRDGRHQHGAWRDGDDRRLCDVSSSRKSSATRRPRSSTIRC